MLTYNHVYILGYCGGEPRHHEAAGCSTFRVATTEVFKDKQGEKQERTTWWTVVTWGATATFARDHIKKGTPVNVMGVARDVEWSDSKTGEVQKTKEIHARMCVVLPKAERSPERGGHVPEQGGV